jgi:hypothetical protein
MWFYSTPQIVREAYCGQEDQMLVSPSSKILIPIDIFPPAGKFQHNDMRYQWRWDSAFDMDRRSRIFGFTRLAEYQVK